MTVRPPNPFPTDRLPAEAEFCDREAELAEVEEVWSSPGRKLVLYGERRLGKTALLSVAAQRLERAGHPVVVMTLARAIDVQDAVKRLLKAVRPAVGRTWTTLVQDVAAKLRLAVTMTPAAAATGLPEFSLGLEPGAEAPTSKAFADALDEIEAGLARRRLKLGLGVDEFQRLLAWGGEDVEWSLKDCFERHRRLSYVLAGSARSLIEEMVTNRNRALWKTVASRSLGPIAPEVFAAWIVTRAATTGVKLPRAAADRIVAVAGPRTHDVLVLAAATWELARAGGGHDPEQAMARVVARDTPLHERPWRGFTDRERRVLRLLASDADAELTAEDVRTRHRLGAPSSVAGALEELLKEEILVREARRYRFDDPFFRAWVATMTAEDL